MRKLNLSGGSISIQCGEEQERNENAVLVQSICAGFALLSHYTP